MPGTGLDDVVLVNPSQVRRSTADEVAAAEAELGTRLPSGYADYAQRLGAGSLGHFVRVVPPASLAAATHDWRARITEDWFWTTDEAGVTPEALQQRGVLVADSCDGDELCFHPADPETLYVLPRNEDDLVRIGPGFLAAIDWMLAGHLNSWVEGWTFEAGAERAEVRESLPGVALGDAVRAASAVTGPAHVVELDTRTTLFLPSIGGRLSLYAEEDENVSLDLTHDPDADPATVERVLAAVRSA